MKYLNLNNKQMKKIELSTENARKMYGKDKVMDELLLANFTKEELIGLPESWEEYCLNKGMTTCAYDHRVVIDFVRKQDAERKLYLLMKEYNNGWVADWGDESQIKYVIRRLKNNIGYYDSYTGYYFLAFPNAELRDKFLNKFRDLIEIYFEL